MRGRSAVETPSKSAEARRLCCIRPHAPRHTYKGQVSEEQGGGRPGTDQPAAARSASRSLSRSTKSSADQPASAAASSSDSAAAAGSAGFGRSAGGGGGGIWSWWSFCSAKRSVQSCAEAHTNARDKSAHRRPTHGRLRGTTVWAGGAAHATRTM